MKIFNVLALVLCLVFSSCSSLIRNQDLKAVTVVKKDFKPIPILIRVFERNSLKIDNNEVMVSLVRHELEEEVMDDVFMSSGMFQEVQVKGLDIKAYKFKQDAEKRADDFLKSKFWNNSSTTYTVDVIDLSDGYEIDRNGTFIEGVTTLLCVFTLCLLPATRTISKTYKIEIRDSTYKKIFETQFNNDARQWLWSPLIFHPEAMAANKPEVMRSYIKNSFNEVLRRVVDYFSEKENK